MWVHWAVAHSGFFAQKWGNIYMFSPSPSEHKNGRFKRDLKNSCRGWALLKPILSKRGLAHVVNMDALDVGLLATRVQNASPSERLVMSAPKRRRKI